MDRSVYLEIYNAGNKNAVELLKTATLLCAAATLGILAFGARMAF